MLKYLLLQRKIKEEILNGKYSPGDKLPSHQEIMQGYNVSSATVSHAMSLLIKEGLVTRRRKAGTFVSFPQARKLPAETCIYLIGRTKPLESSNNINWFVADDFRKGIINNASCRIKLIESSEIKDSFRDGIPNKGYIIIGGVSTEMTPRFSHYPFANLIPQSKSSIIYPRNSVCFNTINASFKAVSYLLRNGHINIGIIFTASKRYAGYQMAFNTFSMHPDERNIIYTEKGKYEDGYKSALKLLEKNTKLTALFADTDIKAFGAIEAFKEKGLSVPDDISVIGFDNISPDCEHFGLTSVDVPRYEMGKAAVAMVEKMILKKSLTSESQVFSGTVIERDSVKKLNR